MNRISMMGAVLIAVLVVGCSAKEPAPAAATPVVEHIATAKQVMLGLTIPASDVLFQLGDNRPTDDAGWERIVATAALLAESGNLLLTGPRDTKQPQWTKFAQDLVARSKDAMAAAGKHDVDAVLEVGNAIYEVCDSCHNKYMPTKVAEQAAAAPAAQ
jgi:hypothetical protein